MHENPVVWWELASHDADASVEFLRKVFDWDIRFDERVGFYTMEAGESAQAFEGGGVFHTPSGQVALPDPLCPGG